MDPVQANGPASSNGPQGTGGEGDMSNVSQQKQMMSKFFTSVVNKLLDEARTNANNGA